MHGQQHRFETMQTHQTTPTCTKEWKHLGYDSPPNLWRRRSKQSLLPYVCADPWAAFSPSTASEKSNSNGAVTQSQIISHLKPAPASRHKMGWWFLEPSKQGSGTTWTWWFFSRIIVMDTNNCQVWFSTHVYIAKPSIELKVYQIRDENPWFCFANAYQAFVRRNWNPSHREIHHEDGRIANLAHGLRGDISSDSVITDSAWYSPHVPPR